MLKYAFFAGCKIPGYLEPYGIATRTVLKSFDVKLKDLDFNCCGYPIRDQDFESSVLLAARNMALASRENLQIITPCKCCYGQLMHVKYWLTQNELLRNHINSILGEESLEWNERIHIKHLLSVLTHDIGLSRIQSMVKKPLKGLKLAAHYGCHALRPGNVVNLDNPLAPTIFENLIHITGADSVEWSRRLECCGSPLLEKNSALANKLMSAKFESALAAGADMLCTSCTHCQIHFNSANSFPFADDPGKIQSILFPQLLGLSMGIEDKHLGIDTPLFRST